MNGYQYQTTTVPYNEKIVREYKNTYKLSESLFSALFSTKDRSFVLKLEKSLTDFMESNVNSYKLNPMNSYCRLLAHNIAEYHGLKHILANDSISVVVFKNFNSSDTPLEDVIGQLPSSEAVNSNGKDKSDNNVLTPKDSIDEISKDLQDAKLDDNLSESTSKKDDDFKKLADIPVPNNTLIYVAKKFYGQKLNQFQRPPHQIPYHNKATFITNVGPNIMGQQNTSYMGDFMYDPIPGEIYPDMHTTDDNISEIQEVEVNGSDNSNEIPILEAERAREEEHNKIMDDIYGESEYEVEPIDDDEGPIIDTSGSSNVYNISDDFKKNGHFQSYNTRHNGGYVHRNNNHYNNNNNNNHNRNRNHQNNMYRNNNKNRQYYNNDYYNNSMNLGPQSFHPLHYNNYRPNGIPPNQLPFATYPPLSNNDFSKGSYSRQPSSYHDQSNNKHRNYSS